MLDAPRVPLALALSFAAALALLPNSAEAGGDDVYGTRGAEQLDEREHRIELSFERGYVKLKVRRTVHNGIARHDQAMLWLDIPSDSVATALRTLGEGDGKPRWFEAELMEAEAAAARYEELTGLGAWYPKDPALLSWRDPTQLLLQVFPVAPHSDKTVEYELDMPARWSNGRWHVELPSLGTDAHPAELVVDSAEPLDQLFADGEVVARGHRVTLDGGVALALAPRDPAPIQLSLASVDTGVRSLVQWRVTVAPELSKLPRDARIVVAIDTSRSITDVEPQRRAALTYLEHFADPSLGAEVAILAFDREVHDLSSGFVPAARALELLEAAPLRQRNGSEVGLALAEADRLLAKQRKQARRIVLLSDFETASRVTPESLQPTAEHSKAILHLVTANDGSAWIERDDGHGWAPLAAATEGVQWRVSAPDAWADADEHAEGLATFEELARPVRIDHLAIRVAGAALDDPDWFLNYEPVLDEGQGIDELAISTTPATKLIVEGKTWNTPLLETVKPSRAEGDRWSALVFGSELLDELDEHEMMNLATRGGAVSPVTSYLAIEPGVRPSTEGLDWGSGGSFGLGSGSGFGGMGARVSRVITLPPFDKQAWLEQQLREGWDRCGGDGAHAEIGLETQSREILEVGVQYTGSDAGLRACIEQVSWSVDLPGRFEIFETWTVAL